jgi:hypothetical protein
MSTSLERYFEMMTSKLQGSRGLHECNGVACPFWCRVPFADNGVPVRARIMVGSCSEKCCFFLSKPRVRKSVYLS